MLRCAPHHSVSSETPGVQQLTEDSLLFDGPRATYGRFRILHQIGAGSVGPVFRGEDSETRRPVVIKVIRVGLTPERVAVVGPALRGLKDRLVEHPSLCPILETGVVDIEPFVVSPVIDGDSLDVALREYGPANMADAVPRLRALADALDAAAAVDVAHGSLHLRDIVVSVEATVLTGIGLAEVLERVGVRPPVRRPYCAPEVALGRGVSPAGDQHALAAIAHEWLSGRRVPNEGILVATSSPAGAAALAAVFAKAMAVDPAARYPSATAFVDGLAGVADAVVPPTRAPRRKPLVTPPQLQFDDADEPPALTFAPPEPEPAPVADGRRAVNDIAVDHRLTGDELDDVDEFGADVVGAGVAGHDDVAGPGRLAADDFYAVAEGGRGAADDAAAGDDHDYATADHDLPMATGLRDLGDHHDTPLTAAYDEVVPDRLSFPYADALDERAVDEPAVVEAAPDADSRAVASWAKWAGVLLVGVVLVIFGARALLRWGTPGPTTTARATGAAVAPGAAATGGPANDAPAPAPVQEAANSRPAVAAPAAPPPSTTAAPAAAPPSRVAAAPPSRVTAAPPSRVAAPATGAATPSQRPSGVVPSARVPAAAPTPPSAPRPAAKSTSRSAAKAPAPRAAPRAAAAPATAGLPGRLLVRSTPSGAEVFLNGERRGVSPVAIRDLALGAYAVRLQRAGFDAVEQRVVLEAARPARALEVALTRADAAPASGRAAPGGAAAATTGSLLIESRPSGARAFVDGVEVGRTPVTVPRAAAGSRAVRIELPGYLVVATTARVEPGARARVAVTLTAERPR